MAKNNLFRILIGSGLAIILAGAPPLRADEKLVDRVVAVVNQEVITQSELDALFQPLLMQFQQAYQGEELAEKLKEAHQKLILQLIEDHLVLQQAKKLGVDVSDQEINEKLDELKKNYKSKGAGDKVFEDALKEQGINLKAVKERIHDQIAIQKLHYVEIRRKVVVSPVEIEKYFSGHKDEFSKKESRKVWVITIPKNEDSIQKGTMDEQSKKNAELLLKDITKKGKDFSEIAKKESRDPHAKDGGLIGFVAKGDMLEHVDKILFSMTDNQISDVLETERAYHIFKVGEREAAKDVTLEQVRDKIEDVIYRQKASARFDAWMNELRKSAFISIR